MLFMGCGFTRVLICIIGGCRQVKEKLFEAGIKERILLSRGFQLDWSLSRSLSG
jgi:hypothetical protein